jgi:SIR2-like protein
MNSASATALPMSTLDDDAWDDLLSFIEERRVIPIVGPELLLVSTDRGPRLLLDWVAEKLAGRLNVNVAELPKPYTLNDVVCWFLAARGRREEAYVRLRSIIKDANFEPPLALRRLAAIADFDLFVSTTFDSLLEAAIDLERFAGAPSTEVLSYAPNRVTDLPSERDRLQRPVVYHLFGKLSASPTYVISDEDLLEFICALQSEHLAPEKLFHELEHNHLLFIGSNFTNWLARVFLRMAKRQRLSEGDRWQTLEFASALYAQALADPKKSAALLREAAALVDGLPATMRPVHDVRQWVERIHRAQQGVG